MRRASAGLAGILAVAAAYVSFLLHAQFAFLALLQRELGEGRGLRASLALMGLAGLAASLVTGLALKRIPARALVVAGFGGCAVSALVPLACRTPPQFLGASVLVGAATGMLTVALATGLRALLPGPGLGLRVGIGTGSAYLACNLPPIFHGGPVVQSVVAAAACAAAGAALLLTREPRAHDEPRDEASAGGVLGFATLVASFLALVWLDSAVFRIVQETSGLRDATWAPGARTLVQGVVHFAAAVVAGAALDRGRMRSLLLATFAIFTAAFSLLGSGAAIAGPLYAVGISVYSTALVLAPSFAGAHSGLPVRQRAAVLYAVAGWLGSALGVGMAQDLHRIPAAFTIAAGIVISAGLLLSDRATLLAWWRLAGPATLLAAAGAAFALRGAARPPDAGAVARGRRAYVAEGCIQCHSQYVRPGLAADERAWGPSRSDHLEESPPLLGTRRIGPDLLNVGNRRDSTWQRIHLRDPRALAPSSRMPSYAHLFEQGSRGDDLVAYLGSLGAGTAGRRLAGVRREPVPRGGTADRALGRDLFASSCAPCHGEAGRGDGPLAPAVRSPFLDLALPGLPRCERVTGDETEDLEHLIRDGSFGTPMAGHELLTDEELLALAARVQELRAAAGASP